MNWFFHRRLCLIANQVVLTGEAYLTDKQRNQLSELWLKWAQTESEKK